jgi:hypothetical protein
VLGINRSGLLNCFELACRRTSRDDAPAHARSREAQLRLRRAAACTPSIRRHTPIRHRLDLTGPRATRCGSALPQAREQCSSCDERPRLPRACRLSHLVLLAHNGVLAPDQQSQLVGLLAIWASCCSHNSRPCEKIDKSTPRTCPSAMRFGISRSLLLMTANLLSESLSQHQGSLPIAPRPSRGMRLLAPARHCCCRRDPESGGRPSSACMPIDGRSCLSRPSRRGIRRRSACLQRAPAPLTRAPTQSVCATDTPTTIMQVRGGPSAD